LKIECRSFGERNIIGEYDGVGGSGEGTECRRYHPA